MSCFSDIGLGASILSVICKNPSYSGPSYAKICRTVVGHIQVHLYFRKSFNTKQIKDLN